VARAGFIINLRRHGWGQGVTIGNDEIPIRVKVSSLFDLLTFRCPPYDFLKGAPLRVKRRVLPDRVPIAWTIGIRAAATEEYKVFVGREFQFTFGVKVEVVVYCDLLLSEVDSNAVPRVKNDATIAKNCPEYEPSKPITGLNRLLLEQGR
jgi:hypothetical protein